jgi:hypothetical protein
VKFMNADPLLVGVVEGRALACEEAADFRDRPIPCCPECRPVVQRLAMRIANTAQPWSLKLHRTYVAAGLALAKRTEVGAAAEMLNTAVQAWLDGQVPVDDLRVIADNVDPDDARLSLEVSLNVLQAAINPEDAAGFVAQATRLASMMTGTSQASNVIDVFEDMTAVGQGHLRAYSQAGIDGLQ